MNKYLLSTSKSYFINSKKVNLCVEQKYLKMKRRKINEFGIFHGIKSGFVVLERPPTLYKGEIIR